MNTRSHNSVLSIVLNDFVGDSRVEKICRTLISLNFDVTVVALGRDDLLNKETKDGYSIERIPLRLRKIFRHKVLRTFTYFEMLARVLWRFRGASIAHCNDIAALPIGVLLKFFSFGKVRVVYDCHEFETEVKGLSPIGRTLRKCIESVFIKFSDRVVTVSPSISEAYQNDYNVKPFLILNCPYKNFSETKSDVFRAHFDIDTSKKIFLYQGGLSGGRGIENLLEGFSEGEHGDLVLVVLGDGPLSALVMNYAEKYKNIYYHQAVSQEILYEYTSSADFGVIFYENSCLNHFYCLPNKVFEYVMAGLPVITSNLFELSKFVRGNNIGVVVDSDTPNGIWEGCLKACESDYDEYIKNVHKQREIFNWESQIPEIKRVFRFE